MKEKVIRSNVAVIGGGLAGLTAANFLARAGFQVTLFEKSGAIGGRARTDVEQGFHFNLGPHALYCSGENITERAKEVSFLRPIRDGEHYVGKRPSEFIFQSLPKIYGGRAGVIVERPAAPGAKNKRLMSVSARNSQHAMNSPL